MRYLFYVCEGQDSRSQASRPDEDYRIVLWRPSLWSLSPPGCTIIPFGVWWLFHFLGLFYNRDYSVLLVYDGDVVVHRSCVFPGYFRFPFMVRPDLQVGDTYTRPDYRGCGIAARALSEIVDRVCTDGRILWYVVNEDNGASIRVAEKAGFRLRAEGSRKARFGIRVLGYYAIDRERPVANCDSDRSESAQTPE